MFGLFGRLFETKADRVKRERAKRVERAVRLQAERRLAELNDERQRRTTSVDRVDTRAGESVWYNSIQE